MSAKTYTVMNGAVPGAAAVPGITTGTVIRTMFQLGTSAVTPIRVTEFWTTFNGTTANAPVRVELIGHTTGPQTTLTTYANADIAPENDPNAANADLSLASNASGFSSQTTEVTPTGTVRNLNTQFVPPTAGFYLQYPLGREPEVKVSAYLRQRVTAANDVSCLTGVAFEQ